MPQARRRCFASRMRNKLLIMVTHPLRAKVFIGVGALRAKQVDRAKHHASTGHVFIALQTKRVVAEGLLVNHPDRDPCEACTVHRTHNLFFSTRFLLLGLLVLVLLRTVTVT